ncbi:MAG: PAS domain-containing protein [Alphaproteobacteria bacterium]|nr:PAS domain-containing protein [Alphaproteobacteria bacterium]
MAGAAARSNEHRPQGAPSPAAILEALVEAVVAVDRDGRIVHANPAAEQFFDLSTAMLLGRSLTDVLPSDSPLFSLFEQVLQTGAAVSENGVTLSSPRLGSRFVTILMAPLHDDGGVAISILEQSIARKIDNQMLHRGAARSVSAMGSMLAHEVKNPLSGIRGAAQLLEQNIGDAERELTQLICEETDRIVALVDRMEAFADGRPVERSAVNIHQVLGHVRKVAEHGFGRGVRFSEVYDPSLPEVWGNRDQLVQVFLNLVKNACEATPPGGGEVVLSTAYRQGVRLAVPGTGTRMHLPLVVSVQDNGSGIPEELRENLFDAFVTNKVNGTGLGLALVAKIVNDHGGVVEFQSEPKRTVFNVMLPMRPRAEGKDAAARLRKPPP